MTMQKETSLQGNKTFPHGKTAHDMGNHTIFNVKDPTVADQGANKKYVDSETEKNATKVNQLTTSVKLKNSQLPRISGNLKADKKLTATQVF